MVTVAHPAGERHAFSLRPGRSTKVLRVLGAIDLTAGVVLLLNGLLLADAFVSRGTHEPPLQYSVLSVLPGLLAIWSGAIMAFGGVIVTSTKIRTLSLWWHSARRDDIDRIEMVRSDLRGLERVLPVVLLRDGRSIRLLPLSWTPRSRTEDRSGLEFQEDVVGEIRDLLGVGGQSGWAVSR
jgi:hypothetical protein